MSRSFVRYTGELMFGNLYGNDTYLYELVIPGLVLSDKTVSDMWVVDARKVGNIGR